MSVEDSRDSSYSARLDRSDVVHARDGEFLLPILLNQGKGEARVNLKIESDDAARLHAQLDRLLNRGLAMREIDKVTNQGGETPVSGNAVTQKEKDQHDQEAA